MNKEYDKISRPFGGILERDQDNLTPGLGRGSSGVSSGGAINNEGEIPLNTPQKLGDLWIENWIKSKNWKPKKQGFYIDGLSGYAEFSNVFVSGDITATTGNIGGWSITTDELYSGGVKLQSTAERILMGAATTPLTGVGIFMGKDGADYEFRAGNPAGDFMHWNGTNLSLTGDITATSGTIGGWTIGATTLTGGGVTLDASGIITGGVIQTATSGERIVLDSTLSNAIKFMNSGTEYGRLEVSLDAGEGLIGLTDSYGGGYGLFLRSTIGAGTNVTASLAAQGGLVSAGGTSSVYNAQLLVGSNYFGVFRDSASDKIRTTLRLSSDWLPFTNGLYDLGSAVYAWQRLYVTDAMTLGGVTINNWTDINNGANTSLSNLSSTSINTSLIPGVSIADIGSSTSPWNRIYVDNIYLTSAANIHYNGSILFDITSSLLYLGTGYSLFGPSNNLGANLGTSSLKWGTIYVDSVNCSTISAGTGLSSIGSVTLNSSNISSVNNITLSGRITFSTGEYITSDSVANDMAYYAGANHAFYQGVTIKAVIDQNIWTAGNLYAAGTKPFLINHPDGSKRLLRYTAQESPEVILRHRGKCVTDKSGVVKVKLPKHFTLVTDGNGDVTVNLTPVGNHHVFLTREPSNKEINIGSTIPNAHAHYEVIAVREGYLNAAVELDEKDQLLSTEECTLTKKMTKTRISVEYR